MKLLLPGRAGTSSIIVVPLGAQPRHRAAGGQDRHPWAAGQQLAQVRGDLDHLLQVVQDQQPRAVAERLGQRLQRRAGAGEFTVRGLSAATPAPADLAGLLLIEARLA
jgi:hypothetical protein